MHSLLTHSDAGQKKHKKLDISRLLGNKPKTRIFPLVNNNTNKEKLKTRTQANAPIPKKKKSYKNSNSSSHKNLNSQNKKGNSSSASCPQEALSSPELLQDINQQAHIILRYSALKSLLEKLSYLNAVDSVGLFRESGHSTSIDLIVRYLGISSHLISFRSEHRDVKEGVHEYACALKQYLREATNPLIPFTNVPKFLQIVENEEESDTLLQIFRITECVLELPRENQMMLKLLVNFLKKISENSDHNKMTVNNLSITLGPSVLRLENQTNFQVTGKCCEVLGLMISFADDVFSEVASENSEEFYSPRERDLPKPVPKPDGKSLRHSDHSVSSLLEFDNLDEDDDEDQEIDYLDFLRYYK